MNEINQTPAELAIAPPPPRMWRTYVKWDELQPGDSIVMCNDVLWHDTRTVIATARSETAGHFMLRTKDENGAEVPPGGAHYGDDTTWLVERRTDATERILGETNLEKHARRELKIAGLLDKDSDYEGMIGEAVIGLVREFSKAGHSGGSGRLTLEVFNHVANWRPLGPLTNNPDEWMQVSPDMMPGGSPATWQSRRSPSCFSNDGGKTFYDIDKPGPRQVLPTLDPNNPPPPTNEAAETSTPLDQPPPTPTDETPIWERVIAMCERWADSSDDRDGKLIEAMKERDRVGRARYGTPLQPNNGRNHIADALAEVLDAIAYVANEIAKRGLELDDLGHVFGDMLWRLIMFASILCEHLDAAAPRPTSP